MTVSFNISKLRKRFAGKTKPVNIVARRFVQIFNDHGVQTTQIPRFIPQVNLDDLNSDESLLAVLTPKILDQTAQLFCIRLAWLEGVGDEIYEYRHCYKQPDLFFKLLQTLRSRADSDFFNFPLRVFSSTKNLDCNNGRQQLLVSVLVEKIAELSDEDWIYRYYIFNDGWDWGHAPSRIQLKATARMIFKVLHTPVPMYVVSPAELQKISDGKVIPRSLLDRPLLTTPSIEDFALGTDESLIAKEVDELPLVLKYIEDFKLQSLMTEEPSQPIAPSEPISEPQAVPVTVEQTTPNKKAGANKKTWDDKKLKALWEESIMPGVTNTSLAKKYGVSRQRIGKLINDAKKNSIAHNTSPYSQLITPSRTIKGKKY